MVSSTQQTSRIRRRKSATNGKKGKAENRKNGTPPFPIHPEGSPTAKPAAKAAPKK